MTGKPEARKGAWNRPSYSSQKGHGQANSAPCFWMSGPQNCEHIFLWFKVCVFIIAAPAIYTHGDTVKMEVAAHPSSAPIPSSSGCGSLSAKSKYLFWPTDPGGLASTSMTLLPPQVTLLPPCSPLAADIPDAPSGVCRAALLRSQAPSPSCRLSLGDPFLGKPS